MRLSLSSIRTDGGTQPRAALDHIVIEEYAELMRAGVSFPAVTVFYDGKSYWLADGFHRNSAANRAKLLDIEAEVTQGTQQDAQWYSFGANQANGLRRSNEDKQRAVKSALIHPKSQGMSDTAIARHVGVDQKTVLAWREKLELSKEIPKIETRTVIRNGSTYQQNTANIGRSKAIAAISSALDITAVQPSMAPDASSISVRIIPEECEKTEAPGRRQQILENAAKRRMIDGLSEIRGLCRGLEGLNTPNLNGACSPEEKKVWSGIARECAAKLRAFAQELESGKQ